MKVLLTPSTARGRVNILSSKSELHRLLIIASLCTDGQTQISYSGKPSKDVIATISCLTATGVKIEDSNNVFTVTPAQILPTDRISVCPNESGSTLRFILPVFSALGLNYSVTVNGRLSERPLSPLYELMSSNGVTLSQNGVYPLNVNGKLFGGEYEISGEVSSQFISGLLMALPIIGGGKVIVTGDFQSKPYVDITVDCMRKFGAKVSVCQNVYTVSPDKYKTPTKLNAGGDWSNSAFFLTLGAISGEVTVGNVDLESKQGDKRVIDVIKAFGGRVTTSKDSVTVSGGDLHGIEIDAKDIPDLIPTLAVIGAVAKGKTRVINAQRLRLKESDRIKSVVSMINALGGNAVETEDGMIIEGRSKLTGGEISSFNDHRIVMSSAVAASVCTGNVLINEAEAVNKSYPEFFSELSKLGIIAKEI